MGPKGEFKRRRLPAIGLDKIGSLGLEGFMIASVARSCGNLRRQAETQIHDKTREDGRPSEDERRRAKTSEDETSDDEPSDEERLLGARRRPSSFVARHLGVARRRWATNVRKFEGTPQI